MNVWGEASTVFPLHMNEVSRGEEGRITALFSSSTLINDQDNFFLVWIDDSDLAARVEVFA